MRISDWSSDVCSSNLRPDTRIMSIRKSENHPVRPVIDQVCPAGKCDKLPSIQGVYVMVVRLARLAPPLECVRLYDLEAGLDGFIAIHSPTLDRKSTRLNSSH